MRKIRMKAASLILSSVMAITISVTMTGVEAKAAIATVTDAENMAENEEIVDSDVMAGEVYIDSAHFPDVAFREFIKNQFDTNGNGILSIEEINNIKNIMFYSSQRISSVKGIEYFTELEELSFSWNDVTSLDVSKNKKLKSLNCSDNKITSLDLSNNLQLEYLDCGRNNISNLNLNNNTKLKELYCSYNNISSLNLKNNILLNTLDCGGNNISSLDVSSNVQLEMLECYENNLNSLDTSNNTKLIDLTCSDNKISSLNLKNNTKLTRLTCENNKITNLNINNNNNLSLLICDDIAAKNLNISGKTELKEVVLYINLTFESKYNLSQLSWLNTNGISDISFYKYDNSGTYLEDTSSYLSGNTINIVNSNKGEITFNYSGINIVLNYDKNTSQNKIDPGIFVMTADRNHYVAGVAANCSEEYKNHLEYSWVAQDSNGNFINMSGWNKSEWVDWKPAKYGTYTIFAKVRVDGDDNKVYTTVGQYDYHPYIKGNCQMPYSGEQGVGYLIGVESYENPNQKYQYEILILDCTLLAQGKPAWTYTTNKFTVQQGNAGWCVWTPQYGYYWTLFRVYDGNGVLIDEKCYGFQNI